MDNSTLWSGDGHVAELGDDKTNEERDGVVCKEVVRELLVDLPVGKHVYR